MGRTKKGFLTALLENIVFAVVAIKMDSTSIINDKTFYLISKPLNRKIENKMKDIHIKPFLEFTKETLILIWLGEVACIQHKSY